VKPTPAELDAPWWDDAGFWHGLHTLLDPVRLPFFRTALAVHATAPPSLLDIGSGGGFVASGLREAARVTAIDISATAVVEARNAGVHRVAVADAQRLPFADGSFQAAVCSEVLEHVEDPGRVIAEAARVLAPGGILLFSTPNRTRWSRFVLIDLAQRWWPTRLLPHDLHVWERFVTEAELQTHLAANDLVIRRLSGIGIRPRYWWAALLASGLLKLGRISYAAAGKRIHLEVTDSPRLEMIGYATKAGP